MDEDIDFTISQEDLNLFQGSEMFGALWTHRTMEVLQDLPLESPASATENNKQLVAIGSVGHQDLQTSNHVMTVQLPTEIPTAANVRQGSSSLPACENWPGEYNFTVSFNPQEKNTKGVAWTYSKIKNKLYVDKDTPCPINFSANATMPNDTYVRVMALYTSPEQVTEIVQRCINHSMEEMQMGLVEARHLIRCESSTAQYHADAFTERHSVLVPFENPPVGQEYSTYIYKFACFGSCAGGPNRRPLMLIFTLERNNQVIGRRKLDIKICACPGRDRKNDEAQQAALQGPNEHAVLPVKRKLNSESVALSEIMSFTQNVYVPPQKKSKVLPNKDGIYVIRTNNKECYDFLKQMQKFFEMCKTLKSLSANDISKAFHALQKMKKE